MTTPSRSSRLRWVIAASALLLASCGSDDGDSAATTPTTRAAETTVADTAASDTSVAPETTAAADTTASAATVPEVPAGTKLRVGDQQATLQRPLETSGEAANVQAALEYATFVGGPPLVEAFNAGAIDVGYVGDTPPVLAQARGQDLVIVGAWRFNGNLMAIVAPPGKSIASVADLKGKSLAYTTGTALQAFAIRALKEAGLTEADVNHVDVPILDVVGTLQSGDVDAGVLIEPILTSYLTDNPDATVVRDAEGLTTGLQLVVTTKATLDDPAKEAAIGDFVYREALAFQWAAQHPDESAQAFADFNKIPLEQAKLLIERNGVQTFVPIDDEVIGQLQELADIFADAGAIPTKTDVSQIFDDRFNGLVALANNG